MEAGAKTFVCIPEPAVRDSPGIKDVSSPICRGEFKRVTRKRKRNFEEIVNVICQEKDRTGC